eukprot:COSAG02_NODE_13393_length_1400_cov_1.765565_2_plen_87_part_01
MVRPGSAARAALVALCDGWRKMLSQIASCANRHKAAPGNIMQPPGTKVDQAGTKTLKAWYQSLSLVPNENLVPKFKALRSESATGTY